MKVLSYNVRGLGGFEKRNEVHWLVQEKLPFVAGLQESKLEMVDNFLVKSIWGCSPCGYSFQPSTGASDGLLSVWDNNVVEAWS